MDTPARPVTIVTGGSRGIGAASALHLARAGHDVVVNFRQSAVAAQQVVGEIEAVGGRAIAVGADVTQPRDVQRLFEAGARLGPVRGLVNNAGATLHIGDLADTPVPLVQQVLDANLLGALLCARQAALIMSTDRGGHGGAIVNVSSAAATLGSAHEYVHYAAAKAGIDALTVGLAKELAGVGVRVNAVAPGLIRTEIHAAAGDPDRLDRAVSRIPMGRVGEPDEIARAIAWLLSTDASYVTGTILRASGGL